MPDQWSVTMPCLLLLLVQALHSAVLPRNDDSAALSVIAAELDLKVCGLGEEREGLGGGAGRGGEGRGEGKGGARGKGRGERRGEAAGFQQQRSSWVWIICAGTALLSSGMGSMLGKKHGERKGTVMPTVAVSWRIIVTKRTDWTDMVLPVLWHVLCAAARKLSAGHEAGLSQRGGVAAAGARQVRRFTTSWGDGVVGAGARQVTQLTIQQGDGGWRGSSRCRQVRCCLRPYAMRKSAAQRQWQCTVELVVGVQVR